MKERFDVTGMTCSACSSHVEKSVGKLTGVENVSVNLLTNSMQVEFDENKLDTAGIIKAVEETGTQNPGQKRPDSRTVRKTADFQP